jgi:hypothetical protein
VQVASHFSYEIVILEPESVWWIQRNVDSLASKNKDSISAKDIEIIIKQWVRLYRQKNNGAINLFNISPGLFKKFV